MQGQGWGWGEDSISKIPEIRSSKIFHFQVQKFFKGNVASHICVHIYFYSKQMKHKELSYIYCLKAFNLLVK